VVSARDGGSEWEMGYWAGEAGGKRRGFEAGYMVGVLLGVSGTLAALWLGGVL
jgi:hypothetical protein